MLATITFGRCLEAAELDWLGPLAEANVEEFDYAESCAAVLEPGAAFEVVVGEIAVTCVVPALPSEEKALELLAVPSVGYSGRLDILRYCIFEVELGEEEQFNPAILGWQHVVFGDLDLGLAPVSYGGDPDRLLFVESAPKATEFFNWFVGSFRQFNSFEELVASADG
jgi:hypothetical protein